MEPHADARPDVVEGEHVLGLGLDVARVGEQGGLERAAELVAPPGDSVPKASPPRGSPSASLGPSRLSRNERTEFSPPAKKRSWSGMVVPSKAGAMTPMRRPTLRTSSSLRAVK